MKTLDDIKGRCILEEGNDGREHWTWKGGTSKGAPSIHAPNLALDPAGHTLTVQSGRRAVWQMVTGEPIPDDKIVYATCWRISCLNPACLEMGTWHRYGRALRKSGVLVGNIKRILAAHRGGGAMRKITPEMAREIMHSNETQTALARRYQVTRRTIYRYRNGRQSPIGGFFGGLMR